MITKILIKFLPFAVVITLLSMLNYGVIQQFNRLSFNDSQAQLAEDTSARLNSGATPESVVGSTKVNIEDSTASYIAVVNKGKEAVASQIVLDNGSTLPPTGVFDRADSGEYRVTWQPKPSARQGIVVIKYKDGYVVAGKNIREAENRIEKLGFDILIGWIITMGATLATILALKLFKKFRKN